MDIRTLIAQTIRIADGNNDLPPLTLARAVADAVPVNAHEVEAVIRRVSPDKRMGAAALADAIADHLELD